MNRKNKLLLILVILLIFWASREICDKFAQDSFANDFMSYWSSARLLLSGSNPYVPAHVMALQKSVGWSCPEPIVMYSPPSTLTYILPFALGNYVISKMSWFLLMLGLIFLGTHWLWTLYGGENEDRFWSLLLLATFSPVYFTIRSAQIVPLVLIGFAGFLYFQKNRNDLLAGICTALIAIKPHVAYLFWIALLLWVLRERKWHILIGVVCGNAIVSLVPLLFNHEVFFQHWDAIRDQNTTTFWATPTLGTWLRLFWGGERHWLQYMSLLLGLSWFLFHWSRKGPSWNWLKETPLLLMVSLMTSIYCWIHDYALLLVPMIQSALLIVRNGKSGISMSLAGFYIIMNIVAFAESAVDQGDHQHYFIWYPLFILICYFTAARYGGATSLTSLNSESRPET